MRIRNLLFIVLAVVVSVSLLCVWFIPSVQDFMAGNTMWNGVRTFCDKFHTIQLDSFADFPEEPDNKTLISIPYLHFSADELEKIYSFIESGGTLLLADDYGYGNQVLEYLGTTIRFDGKPVLDQLFCYKNQWLPKVVEFSQPGDFQYIILNHGTVLQNVTTSQTIAWTTESSYVDTNENLVWNEGETRGRLPVAAETNIGRGKLIIIGDPSLMINAMINRADNFAFISQLLGEANEEGEVLFDTSHLSKTPLDISKTALMRIRDVMVKPYPLMAIILVIFLGVSIWTMSIGGTFGKQPQNS